jgi:quinol monooxygenase YgiN
MIRVVATIEVKPGKRDAYLAILDRNVPNVLAEDGCVAYDPMVDVDSGIAAQGEPRPDVVTLLEEWESLDQLHAHLLTRHMADYREEVKDLVKRVKLQVLTPA